MDGFFLEVEMLGVLLKEGLVVGSGWEGVCGFLLLSLGCGEWLLVWLVLGDGREFEEVVGVGFCCR